MKRKRRRRLVRRSCDKKPKQKPRVGKKRKLGLHTEAEAKAKAEEEERVRQKAEEKARCKAKEEEAERIRRVLEEETRVREEEERRKQKQEEASTGQKLEPSQPSADVDISFLQSSGSGDEDHVPLAKRSFDKEKRVISESSDSSSNGSEKSENPFKGKGKEQELAEKPTEGEEASGSEFNVKDEKDVSTEKRRKRRLEAENTSNHPPPLYREGIVSI